MGSDALVEGFFAFYLVLLYTFLWPVTLFSHMFSYELRRLHWNVVVVRLLLVCISIGITAVWFPTTPSVLIILWLLVLPFFATYILQDSKKIWWKSLLGVGMWVACGVWWGIAIRLVVTSLARLY